MKERCFFRRAICCDSLPPSPSPPSLSLSYPHSDICAHRLFSFSRPSSVLLDLLPVCLRICVLCSLSLASISATLARSLIRASFMHTRIYIYNTSSMYTSIHSIHEQDCMRALCVFIEREGGEGCESEERPATVIHIIFSLLHLIIILYIFVRFVSWSFLLFICMYYWCSRSRALKYTYKQLFNMQITPALSIFLLNLFYQFSSTICLCWLFFLPYNSIYLFYIQNLLGRFIILLSNNLTCFIFYLDDK